MNKLLIPALLLLVISCTDTDNPTPAACQPVEIEEFNGSESTFFNFDETFDGKNLLSQVSFDPGSEDAITFEYDYLQGRLSNIALVQDGTSINYVPTFDGDKLTKLSGTPFGFGVVLYEITITYSGDNITRWEQAIGDPTTGTLYPFQHYEYTYNAGDLQTSGFYFDFAVLAALLSEQTPGAYAPDLVFSNEYGYGSEDAPNPLYLQYNLQNPEMSLMSNVPTTIVQYDPDGNIAGSLGYELTFNEQGFPTLANSGNAYIDFTYDCN